ncbi:MAG: hypothetical protein M1831_005436 [Alyxoria varia]|nr:MAG: hypothetical protein M1831_005436 [Alyxoria varia]
MCETGETCDAKFEWWFIFVPPIGIIVIPVTILVGCSILAAALGVLYGIMLGIWTGLCYCAKGIATLSQKARQAVKAGRFKPQDCELGDRSAPDAGNSSQTEQDGSDNRKEGPPPYTPHCSSSSQDCEGGDIGLREVGTSSQAPPDLNTRGEMPP